MTARLVSPNGGPIFFGSKPGFAVSQTFGTVFDAFICHAQGSADQYALIGAGFGNVRSEFGAASNLDDAALSAGPHPLTAYVEDLSSSSWGDFSRYRPLGISSPGEDNGEPGIACFDAAPTEVFLPYQALFMGNQCQTYINRFVVGSTPAPPAFQGGGISVVNFQNQTSIIASLGTPGQIGQLTLVFVAEEGSTLHARPMSGWTQLQAPPDATGYGVSVFYTVIESVADQLRPTTLTFNAPASGCYFMVTYAGESEENPVDTWSVGFCDGTTADAPSVTTPRDRNLALAFVAKTTASGNLVAPAGWTTRVAGRSGVGTNVAVILAEKVITPAGATGPVSFTNASGAHGAAITLSIRRGPGLDLYVGPAPANVSYTGLPFQPDLVLFNYCSATNFAFQDKDIGAFMFGASDGVTQWVSAVTAAFGSGITLLSAILNRAVRYRRFRTDACIHYIGSPAQFTTQHPNDITASLVSMNPDGFTIRMTEFVPGEITAVSFMAVKANPGRGAFKVGTGTQPGVGTQSFSGCGFAPEAVILASGKTIDEAKQSDFASFSMGMADGTLQSAGWGEAYTWKPAGAGPLYAPFNYVTNQATLIIPDSSGVMFGQAALQSLDADGFTLDWTTSDGVARLFGWVALACDTEPETQPVATTDPLTDIVPASTFTGVTWHGTIIPNTVPGDPVTYFWQFTQDPNFVSGVYSSTTHTDGSGTTPTAVSFSTSVPHAGFFNLATTLFYYRLVVVTSVGCRVYGQPLTSQFTPLVFNNRFRVEQ